MSTRHGDAIKIVNRHRRPEYATEVVGAILKFRQAITIPFVITSMGPLGEVLRLFGCGLGNSYILCRAEGPAAAFEHHPSIRAVGATWKVLFDAHKPMRSGGANGIHPTDSKRGEK